jgi:hypothetical protein
MFWKCFLIAMMLVANGQLWAADADPQAASQLRKIGDLNFSKSVPLEMSSIALGEDGTVYVVSVQTNGQQELLRISNKASADQLIIYRGHPYILDKQRRLYSFEPSLARQFQSRLPYIAKRLVTRSPLAFGTGVGFLALALFDQTFTGIVVSPTFALTQAFVSGVLAFYGLDAGRTMFITRATEIQAGTNFFTHLIAKGVREVTEHPHRDDYIVALDVKGGKIKNEALSILSAGGTGSADCVTYLKKLINR